MEFLSENEDCSIPVHSLESIHLVTVLCDCVHQLAIIGHIMPVTLEGMPREKQIVNEELEELLSQQQQIEGSYKKAIAKKQQLKSKTKNSQSLAKADDEIESIGKKLGNNTLKFGRSIEQNPLAIDNIIKIDNDRLFVQQVMEDTVSELTQKLTYNSLMKSVNEAKKTKATLQETIQKEQSGRQHIKELNKSLSEIHKDRERELQNRNEMIAYLKDQVQEMKAKTIMESKYVNKCAEVGVAQTLKQRTLQEESHRKEIDSLEKHVDVETRVNAEIMQFLGKQQKNLVAKLDFWMEKHEKKDVEAKQLELDQLKASKNSDWERLLDLTRKYKEFEEVVVEDRIQKEIQRRKAEEEEMHLRASVKIQSWWRGVMVRKGFGAYRKKKGKKSKKGKKGKNKK